MSTNYLCIGHCCHDVTDNGYILGGAASYASLIAKKLGKRSGIITSVGPDFLFHEHFNNLNIPFVNIPAEKTTIFHNIYKDGSRTQYIHERAEVILPKDIPEELKKVSITHLCLIADEVDFEITKCFPNSLIGATLQGSLRQWDKNGLIIPKAMDWDKLSGVDIVIISEDDIKGIEEHLPNIIKQVQQVVVTKGNEGADVYIDNTSRHFPSFPVNELEATGAGDAFTCAYLIEFERTKDIKAACIFAHCTASFVVEGIGMGNLPSTLDIRSRVAKYKELYQ